MEQKKKTDRSYQYYIPVKSHVKKYLSSHVNTDPFKITTNNEFGIILFLSLSWKAWIPNEEIKLEMNERMLIDIPAYYHDKDGPYISNRKISLFNDAIEKIMRNELFKILDSNNQQSKYIINTIFEFRDKYEISDLEMDYHNLRRAYLRERETQNNLNKNTHVLVAKN